MIDDFVEWERENHQTIETVHGFLCQNLSSEPEELIDQLCEIEAWGARIGELQANADSWLDRAKMTLRPSKDFGSELDRRTELDGIVAPLRMVRDKLESLAYCIKQRLILGESLLAYHRQFQDHKMKEKIF